MSGRPTPFDLLFAHSPGAPAIVVGELMRRATSAEMAVIERIALAAGILWRCPNTSCRAVHAVEPGKRICMKCGWMR